MQLNLEDVPSLISTFCYRSKDVRFFISNPTDHIQRIHSSKTFYELEILERLVSSIPQGGTVLDIGANVGNHTVFFSLFSNATRIVPFEPNPHVSQTLRANVALNELNNVDLQYVDIGMSDAVRTARLVVKSDTNWGNGHIFEGDLGRLDPAAYVSEVSIRPLDSLAFDHVDFVKIDVEGHELEVLRGSVLTIKQHAPTIFCEVGRDRREVVCKFLISLGYQIIDHFTLHRGQHNLLFIPIY